MSQGDVINYLSKRKKPATPKEIAKAIGVGHGSVNHALSKLRRQGVAFYLTPEKPQKSRRWLLK